MKVKVEINEIKDKGNKIERIHQFRNLYLEDINIVDKSLGNLKRKRQEVHSHSY